MRRRSVLLGASSFAIARAAKAASGCMSMTPIGPLCKVFVERPTIIKQHCPQWCWAASASMIFEMHGHKIDQQEIVQAIFNNPNICLSTPGIVIAQVLSSQWTDEDGDTFQANLEAAYDFAAGINAINNAQIINELRNDRPLIYGNGHHAMVLSQVEFINTSSGPLVQRLGVFDPWPGNPNFRNLSPAEIVPAHQGGQMNFLAAVDVT